jgi:hypothetical protein
MTETRNCKTCSKEFSLAPEDIVMYERASVPATTQCVDCSLSGLAAFWLLGRFRVGKSSLSGKQLITILPETVQFPIYTHEEFVSDAWDPLAYGKDYDPNRSFFDQLAELQARVPHPHRTGIKNIDCEWTDDWWESKNCYLSRSGYQTENLSYAYRVAFSKDSVDLTYAFNVEQSYDSLFNYRGWKLKYCFNTHDCVESTFLYDCRNCSNCFMSWNLRNKQYCILNQQYSKDDYFKKLAEFDLGSRSVVQKLKDEFANHLKKNAVHRENLNTQVVNSRGNFMDQDKDCFNCAFLEQSENCRQVVRGFQQKDCIEAVSAAISELSTRTVLDQFSYGNVCTMYTTNCRYSTYLDACEDCEYCFGSVGLRKKKYCILNKQYTKEEYEKLVEKIKADMKERGEWGQFMPKKMAYGGYNVSLAQIMFPKTEEEIKGLGFKWENTIAPSYENAIASDQLPDHIRTVSDDITRQRVVCKETKLSYNIAPHELAFYKTYNIPLPQEHFDLRTFNRFKPMALMFRPQKGICHYCKREIEHFYDPKLGFEKIACIECYQKEII